MVPTFRFLNDYSLSTMPETPRIAQPGDIFILSVPTGQDLTRLRQKNQRLQNQYGGQLVKPIHITVERFSPEDRLMAQDCIATIQESLKGMRAFQLFTDALIQFFAPYWQSQVLRWQLSSPFYSLLTQM